jgi:hypothetical protein
VKTETPGFVFLYHPEQERLARDVIDISAAEKFRIEADVGKPLQKTIEVRIADGPSDFQDAQPAGYSAPVWSAGLAYQGLGIMVLQARGGAGGGPGALRTTFIHELSHLVMHNATGGRHIPRWLSEGMAMHHAGEWSFSRATAITKAVAFGNVIELSKLDYDFPDEAERVHLAYAESIEFVSYLMGRFGRPGMNAFISALSSGEGPEVSASRAFGVNLEGLEKAWLSRTRMIYAWIPLITSSTTLWFVITVIFLTGYLRKRADTKRRMREMEDEDLYYLHVNAHGNDRDKDDPPGGYVH